MRGLGGLAKETERGLGSVAGLFGSRLGLPGGWDEGEYRMTRSSNRLMRERMTAERYENGGRSGMRGRSRSGRGSGFSDEDLVMLEQLRQNPEVQEELAKHGLSVEDTMWDGLDTATPYQIAAAARTVQGRHRAQGADSPAYPPSAPATPSAPAGYAFRDDYLQDLKYAAALGSPYVQAGNEEASWERALAEDPTNKTNNGGRPPSDGAAHTTLRAHIAQLRERGAAVVPQSAPAPQSAPDPQYAPDPQSAPINRTVTTEPLPPVDAPPPVLRSATPSPSYAAVSTSSYSGLDAEGSMHFNTYGGLYRGMENDPQVERMQRFIGIVGGGDLNLDGDYGSKTHAAVNNLRQRWGMGEGRADSDFLNRLSHEYNQITSPTISYSQQVQDAALPASVSGGQTYSYSQSPPPPAPTPPSNDYAWIDQQHRS